MLLSLNEKRSMIYINLMFFNNLRTISLTGAFRVDYSIENTLFGGISYSLISIWGELKSYDPFLDKN